MVQVNDRIDTLSWQTAVAVIDDMQDLAHAKGMQLMQVLRLPDHQSTDMVGSPIQVQ